MKEEIAKAIKEGIITDTPKAYILNKTWTFREPLVLEKLILLTPNLEYDIIRPGILEVKKRGSKK